MKNVAYSCLLLVLIALLSVATVYASQSIQTSRYTSVNITTTIEQDDLLQQVLTIQFPQAIQTVGEAMDYLLAHSGYHLRQPNTQAVEVQYRLGQLLPSMHRRLGPATLRSALQVLMGQSFVLIDDPLYREISFIVDKGFDDNEDSVNE